MAETQANDTSSGAKSRFELWLDRIKKVLEVAVAIAGASAVFAAIAFGVGYLAAKQHDQTLGIISTTSYWHYVRTGIEFVPRSLSAVSIYASMTMWYVAIIALLVLIFVWIAYSRSGTNADEAKSKGGTGSARKHQGRMSWRLPVVIGLCAVMAVLEIVYFPRHLAPLRSVNTGLLLKPWNDKITSSIGDAGVVYELLHMNPADTAPNRLVRFAGGKGASVEELLAARYGRACLAVIGLAYAVVLLGRWRKRIDAYEKAHGTRRDWSWRVLHGFHGLILRPAIYAMVLLLIVTLPALYGALAMSNALPCVILETPRDSLRKDPTAPSRALTDLSADAKEVVLLAWGQEDGELYALERVKTSDVTRVVGMECETASVLAEWREHTQTLNKESQRRPEATPSGAAQRDTGRSGRP